MNAKVASGVLLTDGTDVILVQEDTTKEWNIPSGRIECGESLVECARREAAEECGIEPTLESALGVFTLVDDETTVLQTVFFAELGDETPQSEDAGIAQAVRVPVTAVDEYTLRSAYIQESIDRYQDGVRLPLDMTAHLPW